MYYYMVPKVELFCTIKEEQNEEDGLSFAVMD